MPISFPKPSASPSPASESPTQTVGDADSPLVNASATAPTEVLTKAPTESPTQSPTQSLAKSPTQSSSQKTVVQTVLAIAAGYLFIALGVIALMGLLASPAPIEVNLRLLLILGLAQLVLATAGGYLTALLAPRRPANALSDNALSDNADNSPTIPFYQQAPFTHGMGLMLLVLILWMVTAIAVSGQEPLAIQWLNLVTAMLGIGTGVWLRLRQLYASPIQADQ